jgi:Na+/H+-dicarboxylate symporter
VKKVPLHIQIIIGLLLGILWAITSAFFNFSSFTADWIAPFGDIFIRLLKLIAVPLVLFSIIQGISGLSDIRKLGRIGAKTLFAYLITTVFAVSIGLFLVNTIKPGTKMTESQRVENRVQYEKWVAETDGVEILDGKKFMTEANISYSERELSDSKLKEKIEYAQKQEHVSPLKFLVDMIPFNIFVSFSDNKLMLQVIFFAIFFGITLVTLPKEKVQNVNGFVSGMTEVFLKMVHIIMRAAPFFVFALLAGQINKMAGTDPTKVFQLFQSLGWYILTVVLGLSILIFVLYPVLVHVFIKPLSFKKFMNGISPAQFLAFSSSSSAATLPVTMDCVNQKLGVSKEVTSFVLPIGATVNMDGTSLYQAIAVVFLAQIHMVDLNLGQQLVIVLTATLASIGSAAVPSAGLIMLIIVLQSVGLNPAWIAIIFPVDRLLDMCRTVANVTGDATVATFIAGTENEITSTEENERTKQELNTL